MLAHEEIRTIISALGTGIGADEFDLEKCRYGKIVLMTDADIDGAHIRTLLLTFLFRQMPQLIQNEMVYIAQPPLYEIKGKGGKKSEYMISESQMRKRMITRGLQGTKLIITDGTKLELSGSQLSAIVKMLSDVERNISLFSTRGIIFSDFMDAYYDGRKLPSYHIRNEGQSEFYYDKSEFEKQRNRLRDRIDAQEVTTNGEAVVAEELHEVSRINEINAQLQSTFKLGLPDFLPSPAKSDTPKALPSRFQLVCGQDKYEVASLGDICPTIRQIGAKGIDVKRFKGLGEMNAEELWETTMNPARRILLKVKLEDAGEADRLFTILMGENVEERRNFIREHALEVQNLDI